MLKILSKVKGIYFLEGRYDKAAAGTAALLLLVLLLHSVNPII